MAKRATYCSICLVFLFLATSISVEAQSNGKISGTVSDAATGESLPGVSVFLADQTYIGTTTGAEGKYFLLSVPPGKYTLVMSFVGFATLRHENVEVFSGRTTRVDGVLQEQIIEGQEIVVSAERPIVVRDRTTSVSYVSQEAIERLPVQELSELVRFQPGVVTSGGGFHFRGGRSREAAYLIDGIPVHDVYGQGGGNTLDVEVESVQEVQVFTGTFDAELGGAQSGIVSVKTRDPGQKLSGSLRASTWNYLPGDDDLFIGGDRLTPFESKDFSVTLGGPLVKQWGLGFFFSGRFEDRVGHLKGERRFTAQDGLKAAAYHRWYRDLFQPDDTRLISLDTARTTTGRLIRDSQGNPITFSSGDGQIIDMSMRRALTLAPKIVLRPTPRSRLTYQLLYNQSEGQQYSHSQRFAPDSRPTSYYTAWTHIATFKRTFGNDKVFSLQGSYKTTDSESYAFSSINDPNIQFLSASAPVTGFSLGSTSNGEFRSNERSIYLSSDFTWQITGQSELKVGVQFRNDRRVVEDLDRSWVYRDDPDSLFVNFPYPSASDYAFFDDYLEAIRARQPILAPELEQYKVDDRFEESPLEFAAYAQDKLEIGDLLVLKAGLRFEYYDIRAKRLIEPRTPTDRIGRSDNFEDTLPKKYLSPRLGISYPISERGALRVAYGHFVQMPAYNEMLKNPIFSDINVGRLEGRSVGNPDLDPERTIKYEMGVQQQLTSFLGVDVSMFYKNIRNLLGIEILSTLDNIQYTRTVNRDHGLVRGGTIALAVRPVGILLHSAFDVTYSDARGSSSDPAAVADVVIAGRSGEVGDLFVDRQVILLDWDQTLTANLSATIGRENNWSVGFISQLATGQPYTPGFLDPSVNFPANEFDNTERKPILFTFDLRAEKRFRLGGVAYGLRVQVDNVFNRLNQLSVNTISGRADQIVRLPLIQSERDMVRDFVGLFTRAEDDNVATRFSAPRRMLVAVTVNF